MGAIIFEKTENSFFLVPSELVDNYLDKANELQLKVILYLLKNGGKLLSEEMLAEKFGVDNNQITQSIEFWVKNGIILKKNERYSINFAAKGGKPSYSADVIAMRAEKDLKLKELFENTAKLYGRPLSPTELNSLITLYEWDGISPELIYFIVSYCYENGKKGFKYIEKTATAWFEEGINTVLKAENKVKEQNRKKTDEFAVSKLIGAENRALTETEKKCIALWLNDYGFDMDVISKAYETTVEKTGKYSIQYMNTVLRSWNEKKVKTVDDVKKEKAPVSSKTKKKSKIDAGKYVEYSWEILKNETENQTEK